MPIYVYQCKKCSEKFESFRSINDSDEEVICPRCGEKKPQRLISSVCCGGSRDVNRGNLRFPT